MDKDNPRKLRAISIPFRRLARNKMTKQESLLWVCLKSKGLMGVKFRRFHMVAGTDWVPTFYAVELKLAIEVVECINAGDYDRDAMRSSDGTRVLRFSHEMLDQSISLCVTSVQAAIHLQRVRIRSGSKASW